MTAVTDEELVAALRAAEDENGVDRRLAEATAAMAPEQRRQSEESIRRWIEAAARSREASVPNAMPFDARHERVGNEELAQAMAAMVDERGVDRGVEAATAAMSPEQREESEENLRLLVARLQRAIRQSNDR